MTQDEIIEMAKEAGLDWHKGWTLEDGEPNRFEAFAKLVAAKQDPKIAIADAYRAGVDSGIAAEREACAKVCDQLESGKYEDGFPAAGMAWECANAIRARGEA